MLEEILKLNVKIDDIDSSGKSLLEFAILRKESLILNKLIEVSKLTMFTHPTIIGEDIISLAKR